MDDGTSDYSNMAIGGVEDTGGDVGRVGSEGVMENGGEEVEQGIEADDYTATTPSSDEVLDSPGDTDDISPIRDRTATIDEGSPDVEVTFRPGDIGA